jgi:uncharacterized membrane protein (UPF0127 family)
VRITNTTRGAELANNGRRANTFLTRLVGLLGRSALKPGEALLIEPCSSVHTAFMRFTIDVVYIDKGGKVVKTSPNMRPFRVGGVFKASCSVIELPKGTIEATHTAPGDEIAFSE